MKKNQHVVPSGDQWAVRGEGNSKKTRITQTQREAIEIARTIARKEGSVIILGDLTFKLFQIENTLIFVPCNKKI